MTSLSLRQYTKTSVLYFTVKVSLSVNKYMLLWWLFLGQLDNIFLVRTDKNGKYRIYFYIDHTIKLRNQDHIHVTYKSPKFISLTVKSSTADSLTRSFFLFCVREKTVKNLRSSYEEKLKCSIMLGTCNVSLFFFVIPLIRRLLVFGCSLGKLLRK